MTSLRFLPEAEAEFLHEIEYYSATRAGTGVRFQAAVEAAIGRAARHPLGGVPMPYSARSVLVRGFPFSVIYRSNETGLLIVAVAPHRRRPGYWRWRVD